MTSQPEKMEFQAEARQLLDLMIHSLYQHKEIFLRELISNASDALDKIHFQSLTDPQLLAGDDRLHIRIDADPEERTLAVSDNGIGMDREELIANIGTIARSGTREFLTALRKSGEKSAAPPELIGQFGVGFYSCFMVADEVVLETRRAGQAQGLRWRSRGDGGYTIEECDREARGTTVTLRLKDRGPVDEEFADYSAEWQIRAVVKRYSDFVSYPIEMEVEREEGEGDAKKRVRRVETLNSLKPLWSRSPAEVSDEEHADFYRHLTHDWEKPAARIHLKAEGTLEYVALLYVPAHRPLALFDPHEAKSKIALYVKRVFIMGDCEEVLPPWLRFMRGLVDSSDLPLNISRETLQHNRQMAPIRKHLVSRTLETFKKMLEDEREKFQGIWRDFGALLKEGIYYEGEEDKFKVAEIALFQSTRGPGLVSLDEYIEQMPAKQKEIYFLAGPDRQTIEASPHLEAFRKKGFEVLLLTDPVDEFAMQRLTEFDGKPIRSIERGEVEVEDVEEKEARAQKEKELKPLLEAVKAALGERVGEVRFSNRLTDSAAVLVSGEHDLTPHMKRMLKGALQEVPDQARILELNPGHPLVAKLDLMRARPQESRFADFCEILYCQALLAEGTPLPDAARFNKLLSELLVAAG
ncbi:MAG: molecular chaperone HtpG [Planctomycetes bacterium]|nr:molecular chaperone HtpG [Planctomycetota bacterium]